MRPNMLPLAGSATFQGIHRIIFRFPPDEPVQDNLMTRLIVPACIVYVINDKYISLLSNYRDQDSLISLYVKVSFVVGKDFLGARKTS